MKTSSYGNLFRVVGPLCGEFTGHRWILLTKASDRGALVFSLICAWINGWVNNRGAGNLRRHRAHYDVTVMSYWFVPDGSKLLPEPMLTDHQWCLVVFIWGQLHRKFLKYVSLLWGWKLLIWDCSHDLKIIHSDATFKCHMVIVLIKFVVKCVARIAIIRWFGLCLGATGQQAITWDSVDQSVCRYMYIWH